MKQLLLISLSALLVASPAGAKSLKWMDGPPGLPGGSKFAVVSGDPGKEGMFTIRAKFPADYAIPPHQHPTDEKVSVKSGGPLSYGMGDKADRANAGTVEKGYHINLGAKMNHWAFTTAPTEVEITAMGPFAITYADPKDDPRNK